MKDYDIVIDKAADNETNTAHIASQLDLYEAARSSFFVFMPANASDPVLELIAAKMKTFDKSCTYDGSKIQELMKLNITRTKVPHFSVGTLAYRRGNETIKFADVPSFDGGSINIDDIIGIDTKSMMEAWLELTYNLQTRTGGRMYEYKMDCILVEYTQDHRPVRTWTLSGCFPTSINEDDFDKSSSGNRSLSVSIEYDRAVMVRGLTGDSKDTEKV